MPVFRGGTLLQAMEIAPKKVKTCLATLIQALAKAMQSVHELGIVHGDFKADNAFIGNDPETLETIAWLIDFGFAQKIGKKVEKFPDIVYWPHEKTTKLEEELLAVTSQDIYGLADMIQRILQSFKLESNKTIFHDWCNTAKQDDPSLRPSLQSLIEIIDLYLAQTKLLHQLKTSLKELIKTITQKISLAPPGAKDTLHFRMLFLKNLDRYLSQIGVGVKYLPNDKKSIQVQILYLIGQNIDKLTPSLKKFIEARNKNQLCKLVDNDLDTILRQVPDGLQPTLTYNA
jgi:serine/threonine protein kinase